MTFYIWFFLSLSLIVALLIFLFLYFCKTNVLTKAISTILVLFAGVGGIKVTPEYRGNLKFNVGSTLSLDGQFIVGGSRTDTTILLLVLGIAFLATIFSYVYLETHKKT